MSEDQSSPRAQVLVEVSRAYEHRVMNNVHRSDYVEAMVAVALADYGWTRKDPWDGWDCEHESGVPLQVTQSAAAQPWKLPKGKKRSPPRFDIAPRTGYEENGVFVDRPGRNADVYVFAWHAGTEETADQREPATWQFYVIAERDLPAQKTIGLGPLQRLVSPCSFDELGAAVERVRKALDS